MHPHGRGRLETCLVLETECGTSWHLLRVPSLASSIARCALHAMLVHPIFPPVQRQARFFPLSRRPLYYLGASSMASPWVCCRYNVCSTPMQASNMQMYTGRHLR